MELKGSKTEQNLMAAFAGESHKGSAPLVSSKINAVNLSNVPNIALCSTTGTCF